MTRHHADKPRMQGAARLREFLRLDREGGMHGAIRALHARPHARAEGSRKAAEYARIARGHLK